MGTSRVTDLFEGGGWGRVGCAKTIFLYSSAVLWTSLPELLQLITPVTAGIWSELKVDNSLPSIVLKLWEGDYADL